MSCFKIFPVYVVFISLLHLVTKTEQTVTTADCGTTKGCLRVPAGCINTDCDFLATYSYQQDHVVFELFGKDSEWVSIGFNDKQEMIGTDSVTCYVNNTVFIKSAKLGEKSRPILKEANDLNLTYSSFDGTRSIQCRFTHPIRPNNSSKLRNLDDEFYMIYATGKVKDNLLEIHTLYGVSTYHVNLTKTNESRATSDGIATDGCDKTMGCLRYPKGCTGTECDYLATYRYQGDHVIFEIFGKDASWVSIGFSDNNEMPDTDAVVCHIADNQTVVIRRSKIIEKSRPPLVVTSNLDLTGRSFFRNNIQCRFSHPFIPSSGSGLRNLSQPAFLLYAKGNIDSNGQLQYHSSEESHRGASPNRVDLKTATDIGKEEADKGGISTAECGKTLGCLRYTEGCSGSSCEFAATYSYKPATKIVTFELFGKNAEWVAIGFSDDEKMPNTDSVFCYNTNSNILLRSGKLVSRSLPSLEEENSLVLLEHSTDGGIRCKFSYPLTPGNTSKLRSLDQEVFLLYAKGSVSGTPNRHAGSASGRGVSGDRVNVTEAVESEATTPSQLKKKVHGSLMTVVWILLASSGLFFARYTRDNWPDTELLGTKVWFQFHRFLMVVVVLGTIISIVIIFVDLDGFTEQEGTVKTHAIIGLVVFVLAILQPIGALLRPHPGTPNRSYFNFFHRSFGVSAFVLSVVTIILGLDFFKKDEAYYTVIGYAVFLAFILVVMEISKCLYERAEETVHEATVPGGMQMETDIVENSSFHRTLSQILLGILDVASLVVTIVVIYFINKEDEE